MILIRYLFYILILLVCGCSSSQPVILPETTQLTNAVLNQKYQQIIEIQGGAVNESSLSVKIIPADSGLIWQPEEIRFQFDGEERIIRNYHRIILSGTPKKIGDYQVTVAGFTLGTMHPGKDFYRKYRLKITQ